MLVHMVDLNLNNLCEATGGSGTRAPMTATCEPCLIAWRDLTAPNTIHMDIADRVEVATDVTGKPAVRVYNPVVGDEQWLTFGLDRRVRDDLIDNLIGALEQLQKTDL